MTSLRNKFWLSLCSLLLILLTVSILSIIEFTRYSHALERVFRENYNSALYCNTMKDALDQMNERAQRMIWQESAARKLDFAAQEPRFRSALNSELGNSSLPGEFELSQHLSSSWEQYIKAYDRFNDAPNSKAELYDGDLRARYTELRKMTQDIADMNMSNMVSVDGQAKQTLQRVRNTLIILMLGGATLAGIVIWTVSITILRPVNDLTRSARQIESGNLDLTLPLRSRDEVGRLAEAFNSMASRLREFKQLDHDRLVRTQQTTQLAIDSLPEPVFVIGPDNRVEISNRAARLHFGIDPGKAISDLDHKWLANLHAEVKAHRNAVEPHGYKSAIQVFVEGQERFFLPTAVPMSSADHRLVGVTVLLIDITRLRQVDEAKSNLVSTVSHELRTPLTSQQLLLGLLISSTSSLLSPTQKRMLEVAKADSDRLYRTIENLLGISRIESGRAQFQFRPLAVHETVASAIAPLNELFAAKNLCLTVSTPETLPRVWADSNSILSVLTNLLSNAIKFTPPGGAICLSAESADDHMVFTIADTGIGIPEEYRPRIFEKFFRVPTTLGPSGAGLGLSIAKDIIEAHGGRIEFESPATGGTTFRFHLRTRHVSQPVETALT